VSVLKRIHGYLGLLLLLPLFVWAVTGFVFLFAPGYSKAFEVLQIKSYPSKDVVVFQSQASWSDVRWLTSVLGQHLLVTGEGGESFHISPQYNEPFPVPEVDDIKRLVEDAISGDRGKRYGDIVDINVDQELISVQTSTNISISLDWSTLKIQQVGADTRLINRLYRVHYLQWTTNQIANKALASVMLLVLITMCFVSMRMIMEFLSE